MSRSRRRRARRMTGWPALLPLLIGPAAGEVAAEIVRGTEAGTGLQRWEWREAGVSVQWVQRLPDQTRAFFQARGFDSTAADTLGRACVFQTVFRNDGELPLAYDLDQWFIVHRGERRPLATREFWTGRWPAGELSPAARIALRWSLLPTRQRFEPGDYNWGMTSYRLPPGESFDLTLAVEVAGRTLVRRVPAIVCAPDR